MIIVPMKFFVIYGNSIIKLAWTQAFQHFTLENCNMFFALLLKKIGCCKNAKKNPLACWPAQAWRFFLVKNKIKKV